MKLVDASPYSGSTASGGPHPGHDGSNKDNNGFDPQKINISNQIQDSHLRSTST
ncbi:MAG: hypothetical protein ACI965_001324 [Paraglaciecola sp.]|jgi:hypothetical protein